MNGLMKKYKASLANMGEPIQLSQIKNKMDMRGVIKYAQDKGLSVADLTDEEKNRFVSPREMAKV